MISKEVEKHLSGYFGKKVKIKSSGVLGGGCINNASKVETNAGTFFLKWNSDSAPYIFIREAESLKELKKAAAGLLVIPEVYGAKEVNDTPGFLILEYLKPGISFAGNDENLGRGLATLHQFTNDRFGFYNDNYCGSTPQDNFWKKSWVEFFRDNRLRYLLDLIQEKNPLPSREINIYEKLIDNITELLPSESTPVIIHGDLWSGNFMDTEKGPALIDPASYYADREMEMAIMTMFGGFSNRFYSAYEEVSPLPADWRSRNRLYQLYHVLNHYYLFGGSYRNQALNIATYYVG